MNCAIVCVCFDFCVELEKLVKQLNRTLRLKFELPPGGCTKFKLAIPLVVPVNLSDCHKPLVEH